MKSLSFTARGRVQGVCFRAFTREQAQARSLVGHVQNEPDGSVTGRVEGPDSEVDRFIEILRQGPPAARVREVTVTSEEPTGRTGFHIRYEVRE